MSDRTFHISRNPMKQILYISLAVVAAAWVFLIGRYTAPIHLPPDFGGGKIAIDKQSGDPVLIVDRDWVNRSGGKPCWFYMVAMIDREKGKPELNWRYEDQLLSPPDTAASRKILMQQLGDCTLFMNHSSADRHCEERHEIHVDPVGYWSYPIKNGKVEIQVEPTAAQ